MSASANPMNIHARMRMVAISHALDRHFAPSDTRIDYLNGQLQSIAENPEIPIDQCIAMQDAIRVEIAQIEQELFRVNN